MLTHIVVLLTEITAIVSMNRDKAMTDLSRNGGGVMEDRI
jgi:hypothetical protein